MAFRPETAIGALIIAAAGAANGAEPLRFPVRHLHHYKSGAGEMEIGETGISFREAGKKAKHSHQWGYPDIQQIRITPDSLRLLTYEDVKWKLGRDREYTFDRLPEGTAAAAAGILRERMDPRLLVVALPDPAFKPLWRLKAKLLEGTGGSEGAVLVGDDEIVYESEERNASRTWVFEQIENISSSGPFDFAVTTFERSGHSRGERHTFRFLLKEPLTESRYDDLWQRLNRPRLTSRKENFR